MYTSLTLNPTTAQVEGRINGVIVAIESSYLAADQAVTAIKQAIIKAISALADVMAPPPPPPAAPAAKKPAKRKTKTVVVGCPCPSCTKLPALDGVYRCSVTRDFQIFFDGKRADFKPTELEAQIVLNNLRSDALRRAA